ncbi:MAG TPA: hypothetical protein PK777_02590, partial [Thermoguttaceae bacterium]|nr:hypothetical protein [Thermoguttaceae bacterium]
GFQAAQSIGMIGEMVEPAQIAEVLAWLPAGTPVQENLQAGQRVFRFQIGQETKEVRVPAEAAVRLVRATPIPPKYQEYAASGIEWALDSSSPAFDPQTERFRFDLELAAP